MKRLPKLMYAVGSRVIPRTGHALERVCREFRHFQVRKYGLASLDSAKDQIGLFMIGYTLEQMYKNVQRDPEKWAGHPLTRTLLYKMWTQPRVSVLIHRSVPLEGVPEVEPEVKQLLAA